MVANTAPPPASFTQWQELFFSTAEREDPAISGPTADPDGTGLPNLLRYGLGLGRHDEDLGAQPAASTANGVVHYTHRRLPAASDVTYDVFVCDDLAVGNWIPAVQGTHLIFNRTEATGDGITETVHYHLLPPAPGKARFLRLRIVLLP
jgi:hypothetical protein